MFKRSLTPFSTITLQAGEFGECEEREMGGLTMRNCLDFGRLPDGVFRCKTPLSVNQVRRENSVNQR